MTGAPFPPHVLDRAKGCLLGLAVGDALGTTLEGVRRDSVPRHTELMGGGPWHLAAGEWTDDTAMALAFGHSLVAKRRYDEADALSRYAAWRDRGLYSCVGRCVDIGSANASAINAFLTTGARARGRPIYSSQGNGSLMRLAPAAIFGLRDAQRCMDVAHAQSLTTHGAEASFVCAYVARAMRSMMLDPDSKPWLEPLIDPVNQSSRDQLAALLAGGWMGKERAAVHATGFIGHTLEAALWAIDGAGDFETALVRAVNLGQDADTVGAVTGQIAGAIYGASGIPKRWLGRLAWREAIEDLAEKLVAAAERETLMGRLFGR